MGGGCVITQESVLGPIFFNIFLRDVFLITCETEFTSYEGDNTLHYARKSIDDVI